MCDEHRCYKDKVIRINSKKMKKHLFARPSVELARLWPSFFNISVMRRLNKIQLSPEQLKVIYTTIKTKAPCKFLVFGLGNDSVFWSRLNRDGITIFLEDNEDWFQKMTKRSKDITAYLVNYNTRRKDWKMLIENPSLLNMTLSNDIENEEWDVILVDAPAGWNSQKPGRMKSIFLSSRLIKNSGDIFVHDCNRKVEDIYCNIFLKKENLKTEIKAPLGYLRHYHIITPPYHFSATPLCHDEI